MPAIRWPMRIVKVGSDPPPGIIYIQCDCGQLIKHPTRRYRVTCQCGRTELLKMIRKGTTK